MRLPDCLCGLIIIAMAALNIFAASAITKRKNSAIRLVSLAYGTIALFLRVYGLGGMFITGRFILSKEAIIQNVFFVVVFFVNKRYFEKRKNIFAN